MADPITAISLGSTVAGGIMGAVGAGQSAGATADAARYQAAVARNNRQMAGDSARYGVSAGRQQAQTQDFKNRAVQGQTLAAQSASGIDTQSGSPLEVRESQARLGRLDTENIMQRANLAAYGENIKATGFGAEAGLQEAKASSAESAGTTGILTSLISSGAGFGEKWLKFQNAGIPGFGSIGTGGL